MIRYNGCLRVPVKTREGNIFNEMFTDHRWKPDGRHALQQRRANGLTSQAHTVRPTRHDSTQWDAQVLVRQEQAAKKARRHTAMPSQSVHQQQMQAEQHAMEYRSHQVETTQMASGARFWDTSRDVGSFLARLTVLVLVLRCAGRLGR